LNIKFLLFLPLEAWTGGSLYQQALVAHLRQKGHQVQTVFVDDLASPDSLASPESDLLLWDGMSIIKWFWRWRWLPAHLPQALIVHGPFSTSYLQDEPWLPYLPE
jgi:hypothetical protein